VSHESVMTQKQSPSVSSAANELMFGETNCGSRLGKNTAIFGFVRLLITP